MSGFTESSKNDNPALDYYHQAADAARRGEFEFSEKLCLKAAKLYEQAGKGEVTVVYNKLGMFAYTRGDLDAAEQWYRKALEIDNDATWRDWLTLHGRLWRHRFLSVFSK